MRFVTEEKSMLSTEGKQKSASAPYIYLTFRDPNRALINICFISKILLSGLFTYNALIAFHQIFFQREQQESLMTKLVYCICL